MKTCSTCKIEKPYTEFGKNKSIKDGYHSQCKLCRKQYCLDSKDKRKKYLIDNAEHIRQQNIQYRKQWDIDNPDYYPDYIKQYFIKNGDKISQYMKQWRQSENGKLSRKVSAHKRRILLRDNTIGKHFTANDLIMKLKLQKGKCIYCEISIKNGYHIDHIIPPCDGGGNEAWNIQLLCAKCNKSKHDNPAYEYAQKHGKLV